MSQSKVYYMTDLCPPLYLTTTYGLSSRYASISKLVQF